VLLVARDTTDVQAASVLAGARGRNFEWQNRDHLLEGDRVLIGALLDGEGRA
jgi:hypothetical protein